MMVPESSVYSFFHLDTNGPSTRLGRDCVDEPGLQDVAHPDNGFSALKEGIQELEIRGQHRRLNAEFKESKKLLISKYKAMLTCCDLTPILCGTVCFRHHAWPVTACLSLSMHAFTMIH